MSGPRWIAADWGTSNLRAWSMEGDRAVAEATSERGMGTLAPEEFEDALMALVVDWLDGPTTAVICGMAGSRQGWAEAPYARVPCAPAQPGAATRVKTGDPRLDVHILPGLKQTEPADVMRGEETQIAGFLETHPGWDGVLCLPGTHSKWAHVSAGEVVSFRTFMTGELFALLSGQSVLRHALGGSGWDEAAFDAAVERALSRPVALTSDLFGLRAEGLVHGLDAGTARARLSGLLIGAELAAARPYWLGQQVAIVGAAGLSAHYARALEAQGIIAETADAEEMTLAGLIAARHALEETA